MLLLAQACRKTQEVDPSLQADLKQVITLMPRLFEEAFKISLSPVNNLAGGAVLFTPTTINGALTRLFYRSPPMNSTCFPQSSLLS